VKDAINFTCALGHVHSGSAQCVYEGEFRVGQYCGRGEYRCSDGRAYKGQWKDGLRHGVVS
jgi:hypothetical protein